jgi:hypothetical protein
MRHGVEKPHWAESFSPEQKQSFLFSLKNKWIGDHDLLGPAPAFSFRQTIFLPVNS